MTVDHSECSEGKHYANSYFGDQPLNRVSFLREDETFLKLALEYSKTQYIPFFQGEALVDGSKGKLYRVGEVGDSYDSSAVFTLIKETVSAEDFGLIKANNPNKSHTHLIFLGLDSTTAYAKEFIYKEQYSGTPIFAINFADKVETDYIQNDSVTKLTFQSVFNDLTDNMEASLYSHARMYTQWSTKFKRCVECGEEIQFIHGGSKWVCTRSQCPLSDPLQHRNNAAYPRTDPVVITAIVNRDWSKCCLARSKRSIGKGIIMYSTVAGFMEPGETIESSCQREVWEETGIDVKYKDITIVKSQPWPYPQNLMIGCIATVDFNGQNEIIDLNHDPELLDAQWFDTRDLTNSLATYESGFLLPLKLDNAKYSLDPEITVQLPGKNAIAYDLVTYVVKKFEETV
ncbi:NAD-capped RNA hydrolase Npy1p [Monosporozyma unispora]